MGQKVLTARPAALVDLDGHSDLCVTANLIEGLGASLPKRPTPGGESSF